MPDTVFIGGKPVGNGHHCYVIAEIGLNHNGDLQLAKSLIDAAAIAGCDAVKFQKRTPELCVPPDQRDKLRETPWGTMTYMEYRHRVEFGEVEFNEVDRYCKEKEIAWFASCWDEPSIDFIEQFDPVCHKIASASLTDHTLLRHAAATDRPLIVSTGMSSAEEIDSAIGTLPMQKLLIAHSTSTYPCPPEELNLKMIESLRTKFDCPIGYSGHEVGLQTTLAATVLGASFVERHITLDRSMWGSDQAASIEPHGFGKLVRDIRVIERALGDGVKRVYESELSIRAKLRRV